MTQPAAAAPSAGASEALVQFANQMAQCYQSTVYLCGSALVKPGPRDIDVRISLDDAVFTERYGDVAQWIAEGESGDWSDLRTDWSKDCTRQTRLGWRITGSNIDFQVYPESWAAEQYGDQPRLVLAEPPR